MADWDYPLELSGSFKIDKTFLNSLYTIDMNICVSKVLYNLIERLGKCRQRLYIF